MGGRHKESVTLRVGHTQYLQVRCCCQPQKMLGYLPVPRNQTARPGLACTFTLKRPPIVAPGNLLVEPLMRWQDQPADREYPIGPVRLVVEVYGTSEFWRLAFKSEDVPVEVLRRIPGFIEA